MAAALVLACLVAIVWLGRAAPVVGKPAPPVTAAAASPPPSPAPVRAPLPRAARRAARVLLSTEPARVSGCVVHANGDPAVAAVVHVPADTVVETDGDGCFRAELPPGDYALWASVDHVAGWAFAASLRGRAEPDACAEAWSYAARRARRPAMGTLSFDDDPSDADETFTDDDGRVWPAREASDWTPLTLAPGEEVNGVELVLDKARTIPAKATSSWARCQAAPCG